MFLLGLLVGLVLMMGAVSLPVQTAVESAVGGENQRADQSLENSSDTTYYLRVEDARYLNRIFMERSHEVAYCGIVTETDRRWVRPWLADTQTATSSSVTYTSSNCPGGAGRVLMHTHPSGNPALSDRDRQMLRLEQKEAMCVQAGELPTTPGTFADTLVCYELSKLNGETTTSELPVVVEERDIDTGV